MVIFDRLVVAALARPGFTIATLGSRSTIHVGGEPEFPLTSSCWRVMMPFPRKCPHFDSYLYGRFSNCFTDVGFLLSYTLRSFGPVRSIVAQPFTEAEKRRVA